MSKKKQKEIIKLLEATLHDESLKINGGNSDVVESLTKRLEKVKMWEKKKDE
jgi:16S rRNA G1207 methylase RsmC